MDVDQIISDDGSSGYGDVIIIASGSIVDVNNDSNANITGNNVTLTDGDGDSDRYTIGEPSDDLEIDAAGTVTCNTGDCSGAGEYVDEL
ncbi:MAG: hypothetical protein AB1782_03250 [Cyanobacteriota bacterium]